MIGTRGGIGFLLFALYLLQLSIPINWNNLSELQQNEQYKLWSGLFLFIVILTQWYLTFGRVVLKLNYDTNLKLVTWHKWIGVFAPIVYFFHSARPGYGLLFLLTIIFFANLLTGYLNDRSILIKGTILYYLWLVPHIILSVAVLGLTFIHIWIVFYFE